MAETATDVRVVARPNPAVRPVSMPVVDRVASGVGNADCPDHREVLRADDHLLVWQDLLILATAAP